MADIKIFGKNVPKWTVYGSVIGGGGALIYAYVRNKNKAKAAAATATTANTSGGYGTYAYGYGSSAQEFGYGAYGYGAYSYGSGGLPGEGVNYGYGQYGAGSPTAYTTQATTNQQWSAAVVSALTNSGVGYTGQQVLGAIAPYLAGQPVSSAQAQIVQQAIAVDGYPPQQGPSGNPPGINTASTTSGGGGGTGQTSNVTVPATTGQAQEAAFAILAAAGLKATGTADVPGKTLIVQSSNPPSGASVAKGSTVKLTSKVKT
jgi:PASTA domain